MNLLGGGGAAGEVNYPPHLLMIQQEMLYGAHGSDHEAVAAVSDGTYAGANSQFTFDVTTDIESARAAAGGSPYATIVSYDPSTELGLLRNRVDEVARVVKGLNPLADFKAILKATDEALALADFDDPFDATAINNLVTAFDNETKTDHLQQVSRVLIGAFDARAIVSTGSQMAVAIAEDSRLKAVETYRRQLELDRDNQRFQQKMLKNQNLVSATNEAVRMYSLQVQAGLNLAALEDGAAKTSIVAQMDRINFDILNEVKDATWDLDLYNYANATTSSIAGAATMPRGLSEMERNIGMIATLGGLALQGVALFV